MWRELQRRAPAGSRSREIRDLSAPGYAAPGTLTTGGLALNGGVFNVLVGGSSAYTQDKVASGAVTLSGTELNLATFAGYVPQAGDKYVIINNSASGATGINGVLLAGANLSVAAGTPLTEIEAAVAEHGQHLIAEPPDFSALFGATASQTLGGVVAANLSGPRRIAWGAMRDHVLGVRAVNGTGEIIRSGGRVLKNVTGLDLCKLLAGSHGTLGVITEVTLKVLPAPEAVGTVVLPGLEAGPGVAVLSAALGSPYGVSAAAWLPADAAARIPDRLSALVSRRWTEHG